MKQAIARRLKKATALSVKLGGLGVIGFNNYYINRNDKKMIPAKHSEQKSKKAS